MTAIPAFMRAYPGGHAVLPTPPLTVTKAARDLHIPAAVLALDISWPARLVLADVLDLHKVNGKVWANDEHFVERCRVSKRTIGSAIQELVEAGLLHRDTNQKAQQKRILTPLIDVDGARLPMANSAIGLLQNLQEPIAKSAIDLLQILPQPIAEFADINTSLNTKGNTSLKTPPSADASATGFEKKIGEELSAELPAGDEQSAPPVAPPPRQKPAKAGEPEHFAAFWAAWPKREARADAVKAFAKLSADDQAAAASRADTWLTARPDLLDPARYRFIPHATTWLNQERWTDQAPILSATTSHVNPTANTTSAAPRPTGGQKPTGDAAIVVAEGLMRRRFAKPVGD